MAGVRVGRCRSHLVAGVRVRRCRSHLVTGVRVDRRRSHLVTGVRVGRRGGHRRRSRRMMGMVLGLAHDRGGETKAQGDNPNAAHAGTSSRGRTVTTLNMPACMWYSM